ncbi:hypothetical protein [Providencia rettgeri]|uniref:hypothetical protein n=1 Tax=Providencia rettgeri TaxID=587 RepID=UPI0032DA4CEA
MEFKHSPAPWMATKREFFIELYDDNGSYVGLTNSTANAHLIAAAPELLEALIEMQRNGRKQGWNDKYESSMEKTRLAIAKALGEVK